MKKVAKLGLIILALALLVGMLAALTACNPANMGNITGTYELTVSTRQSYGEETVDIIKTYGIKAYLVITGAEYGYYIYMDNDVPVKCKEVKLEYLKNDKEEVTNVYYREDENRKQVSFFVDKQSKKDIRLRWSYPTATKLTDARETQYNKVSDDTDLTYVTGKFSDMPIYDYGTYIYDGIYEVKLDEGYADKDDYIYRYYMIDAGRRKADYYYATKADETAQSKIGLDIAFTKNAETKAIEKITIGAVEYTVNNFHIYRDSGIASEVENETVNETLNSWGNQLTLDAEFFAGLIAEYRNGSVAG